MARIHPVDESSAPPAAQELAAAHVATGSRMTNMKWTLAHSPVALDALLRWYPLHDEVAPVLGERPTWLFCHAISTASECLICSTFFRRLLIDAGEDPASLELDAFDELVDAPLNDGLAAMEGKTPLEVAEQSAGNLLPVPWVETSDVAEAVRFLVSEKARYLTGTEFVIDAGLLTR